MAGLIRALDWTSLPLGPPEKWPQSYRTAISIALNSRHPMFLALGSALALIYNDAFSPILGKMGENPAGIMGKPLPEVWPKTWPAILPLVNSALAGQATWSEDLPITSYRNGKPEKIYLTFSCSPIHDEIGQVAGIFWSGRETTNQVRSVRQLANANEHLKIAATAANLGLFSADVETGMIKMDWLCRQNFGVFSPMEMSVKSILGAIHPDDRDRVRKHRVALVSGHFGDQYEAEYRTIGIEDGKERWIAARGRVIFDAAGTPLRILGATLDITPYKDAEKRSERMAQHDALTGLPNRALLFEYCEHLLASSRRRNAESAVLFIDLDRFKPINDLHGHAAGDAVLKEVARRLTACVRKEDIVARLGGDEFIIVLPRVRMTHSPQIVAKHIIREISRPINFSSLALNVSPSIGISMFPKNGGNVEELIRNADLAMYAAKEHGRNTFRFYHPDLHKQKNKQDKKQNNKLGKFAQVLETRLIKAIESDGLELLYQPVIDVQSGFPVGVEALLRMPAGDGGAVAPRDIISIAESGGMMPKLSQWIVQNACQQQRRWHDEGHSLSLAINVSPAQLKQEAFISDLDNAIRSSGISPGEVQIELPERALQENAENTLHALSRIKELGMEIALDEFGTGSFSLNSLSSLPIDAIKIDQSCIKGLTDQNAANKITDAIIALARCFNLTVIGVGIESKPMLDYLQNKGCDQVQGFWFSKPLKAAQFEHWYREYSRQIH